MLRGMLRLLLMAETADTFIFSCAVKCIFISPIYLFWFCLPAGQHGLFYHDKWSVSIETDLKAELQKSWVLIAPTWEVSASAL